VNSYSRSRLLCGSLRNPISGFMILEIGILFFVVVRWRTYEKAVIGVSDKKKKKQELKKENHDKLQRDLRQRSN